MGESEDLSRSPLLSDYVYKWLDNALDSGISEYEFWNMTLIELERAIASKRRMEKLRAKEKASYDYVLANLIGQSVARIYSKDAKYPEIYEAYPSLFDREVVEESRQEKINEISAIRFKQFAASFNSNFNKEVRKDK